VSAVYAVLRNGDEERVWAEAADTTIQMHRMPESRWLNCRPDVNRLGSLAWCRSIEMQLW